MWKRRFRSVAILALGSSFLVSAQSGSIDAGFASNFQAGGGANSSVICTATDASGNILIGGTFTQFAGLPANRFARVMQDGTFDPGFTSMVGLVGFDVRAIAVQSDGRVLLGGNFSSVGGFPRPFMARLNQDGSIDTTFIPSLNLPVYAIVVQPDGAILIGGQFFSPGFTRRGVARLFPDGSLDTSFGAGVGADNTVRALALDSDGNVAVAGSFTNFNGSPTGHVALLDANGTPAPGFSPLSGADDDVHSVAILPGQRIMFGGNFNTFNGTASPSLVCLGYDGSIQAGMPTIGFSSMDNVTALLVDQNDLVICGGSFSQYQGHAASRIVRLAPDGDWDASFSTGSGFNSGTVVSLSLDPQGFVVAGGTFSQYQGTLQSNLTRIENCLQSPYFMDGDQDGAGDAATVVMACSAPPGHVLSGSDCDDDNAAITGPITWYLDADGDGMGDPTLQQVACTAPTGFVLDNSDCDDQDEERFPGAPCSDGDPSTVADTLTANCVCVGEAVDVAAKVILEGPYNGASMNDGLRAGNLIPVAEPYTALGFHPDIAGGGETVDPSVFSVIGADAIVDWLMLVLREKDPPYARLSVRMALLQRDGDVVDLNGSSPVRFAYPIGSYMLEVRHRNHLGIMTAVPLPEVPMGTPLAVDFTSPATACYGTNARRTLVDIRALFAGNSVRNGLLSYTGPSNDRDAILVYLGSSNPNGVSAPAYVNQDLNMDGVVRYTGSSNDRDRVLINVGSTTPNSVRLEQLP